MLYLLIISPSCPLLSVTLVPQIPTFSPTLSLYFLVSPLQDSTQDRRHVMLVLTAWLNVMTSSCIHFLGQLDVIEQ